MNKPTSLQSAGRTFNTRIEGSGPPLLYLGGSSFDLSIKAPVFDSALPEYFTVAAYDPRGLGNSDLPIGDWSMRDYAQDALLVLDALGWDKADILGESFGAMTALHLAVLAPQRLNRLALAAGSAGGDGGSSYPIHNFLNIADPHKRARASLSVLDSRFEVLLSNDPEEAQQRIKARVANDSAFINSHNNRSGYPRLLRARAQHDCWAQLPEIKTPTLIFAGSYDQQAPIARAKKMLHALPNASLNIIDSCHGHCFNSQKPVAKIIEQWANTKHEAAS